MKISKKIAAVCLCFVITFWGFGIAVSAATKTWSPVITLDNVTATEGDTVFINVNLSENLYGIMAFTFSICYDDDLLTYKGYRDGLLTRIKNDKLEKSVFSQYYIAEHDDYISIVDCENKNRYGNGTIITLEFSVNEDISAGTYPIKIANVRPNEKGENLKGCFANWRGDTINPVVEHGSITVPLTQENCVHSFGGWSVKTQNSCVSEGVEVRNCTVCGKMESRTLSKSDHTYESVWTVDLAATADEDGILSRHCADCNDKTDYRFYTYSSATKQGLKNEVGTTVTQAELDALESSEGTSPSDSSKEKDSDSSKPDNSDGKNPDEKDNDNISDEDNSEKIPENADLLIEQAKKDDLVKTGIAGKIYDYLYGTNSKNGILNLIFKALKEFLERISK